MAITTVKIHPAIGIARVGNSPAEYFVGPELPGDRTPPPGGYKDAQCRVKRQAARFRLFGYDQNGALVQELTAADATITWTAHLANTKATWERIRPLDQPSLGPRNPAVTGAARAALEIDPGPRTITGPNQAAGFNTGTFMGVAVPLGEMRTDAAGRLLILGGFGHSSSPTDAPLTYWAENSEWHDDVSDGPVTASVLLNGSAVPLPIADAWVICGPPKFAPALDNIKTLYDALYQAAVDQGLLVPPAQPSFNTHIYPLLDRAIKTRWVNAGAAGAHTTLASLVPPPGTAAARQAAFNRLRDPNLAPHQTSPGHDMPNVWSDVFDVPKGINEALTRVQYAHMQQWVAGNFVNDWTGAPPAPATQITPEGLDRAALENCVGGAFYPGIETSWRTRDFYTFKEPFRLDAAKINADGKPLVAGDLTKQMALPWQTDFYDCRLESGLMWWPAQRPDDVWPEDGSPQVPWSRDLIQNASAFDDMVANWSRLGFVVQKGTSYLETERHVVCRSCFIVLDRSTFSRDQVDAVLTAGPPATFDDAFYVVVEGFTPSALGVTGSAMTPAQLAPIAPTIAFTRPDTTPTPGMSAAAQRVLLEDDTHLNVLQRVTFVYRVSFTGLTAFGSETEVETLTAGVQGLTATSEVTLTNQPNPFMLDGPTSWLSIDLRVFQITEGDARFGQTMGGDAAAAVGFIQSVLTQFNGLGPVNHPFGSIATDQNSSRLELSRSVNGKRVFNFAVAQVRYQGKVLTAADVRVFFRLFTTAATGLNYNPGSTYRRDDDGTKVVPLLGVEGGEVVTIPCFASARVDTTAVSGTTQPEDVNKRTLAPAGATEVHGYFGCWLDFNQTELRIPTQSFAGDGPYGANARSIQDAIRGLHQCLAAEIYFVGQPIPAGASPSSNDKLSQRNLAIVESDNPGGVEAHTVAHTFELAPSRAPLAAALAAPRDVVGGLAAVAAVGHRRIPPDELMIRWYDLPRDTDVQLYLPSADAGELLRFAGQRYDAKRLDLVDQHTLRCRVGDVSYVPVPSSQGQRIAGLLTLVLPDSVRYDDGFRLVVHQVSGVPRRVIGSFQVSVAVREATALLGREERALSVLRQIALSIPAGDRWRPVFDRYLGVIGGRVRGFGGDPDTVRPSPDGGPEPARQPCPPAPHAGDLFCLNIPWRRCDVEGEIHVKLRFRRKT